MGKVTNFARFYALLKRMPGNHDGLKEQLVLTYTGNRTSSLKDIKQSEYDAMCASLQETLDGNVGAAEFKARIKSHRSKVLHWLQVIGIDTTDWDRVDAYCLDSRIAGKVFRKLTIPELEALVPKLKAIARKAKEKPAPVKKQQPTPVSLSDQDALAMLLNLSIHSLN